MVNPEEVIRIGRNINLLPKITDGPINPFIYKAYKKYRKLLGGADICYFGLVRSDWVLNLSRFVIVDGRLMIKEFKLLEIPTDERLINQKDLYFKDPKRAPYELPSGPAIYFGHTGKIINIDLLKISRHYYAGKLLELANQNTDVGVNIMNYIRNRND